MPCPKPALSSPQFEALHATATWHAGLLVRRGFVPRQAHDDIRQHLVAECLARMDRHDPTRGSIRTFTEQVARSEAINLGKSRHTARRLAAGGEVHVSQASDEWIYGPSADVKPDCRFDVHRVLAGLSSEDHIICSGLVVLPVSALAKSLGMSRGSLRRRVERIRRTFEDAGLRIYLEAA